MHNTTVAKLLAKENIEVQYGNYHTAWFDIQSRVLGLPMLKDMGKDVHDLFVGHEVGHALFTPYEGWHDTPEKLEGCPRSYINVVEDARIEKLIRRAYPGLVGPMARGYKKLSDEEFFGDLSDPDWDSIKLIDKINLKAKLQNLIELPFNTEEATLYNKTMNTESFEEVLVIVKEILAYTKENTPELIQKPEPEVDESPSLPNDDDMEEPQGHDDAEPQAKEQNNTAGKGENDSDEEDSSEETEEDGNSNGQEESEDSSIDQEEKDSGKSVEASKTPEASREDDSSITDIIFRDAEKRLLDTGKDGLQTQVARDRGRNTINSTVIPYAELREERKAKWANQEEWIQEQHGSIMKDYTSYIKSVKKSVNVAVKEFEMKKAAFQWQRATTGKTGVLDVNSLHAYKTHDDIFKRVTSLADAKNHGMIMLIDYSGSMSSTMEQVLDQLIHLVSFCKAINIPFDVYAFTTAWREDQLSSPYKMKDGEVDFDSMTMPQLISSSLKKADYEEALQHLYQRKMTSASRVHRDFNQDHYWDDAITGKSEEYGSTPLNAALVVAHHLVKKFIRKHATQKMNLVVLSDGDSNQLQVVRDHRLSSHHAPTESSYYGSGEVHAVVDGKKVIIKGRRNGATRSLLENLKTRYGVTTLGFFIAQDSRDWKTKLGQIEGNDWVNTDSKFYKSMQSQYTKQKVAIAEDALGYDKFFMLKPGKNLSADSEDFADSETEDMTVGQIRSTFKKYSKNKKNNKVLMKQIGGVVA